jgi:hypothetical protein
MHKEFSLLRPQRRILVGWCVSLGTTLGLLFAGGLGCAVDRQANHAASGDRQGITFFVATNGNDQWSGTLAAPNRSKSNGPFATLTQARDAIRQLKRSPGGSQTQSVTVNVRGGHYFLPEPLVLTPEDSGTSQAPVVYAAYKQERPVVSGGRIITGWQPATINGKPLWTVDLPEVRTGKWFFRQLFVNGERRTRARHPNQGYLAVAELPGIKKELEWTRGQTSFRYAAGDLQAWPTINQAEVCVMNRWAESHLPVVGVEAQERLVKFGKRSVFKLDVGDLYYLENALEILDQPGEWFLDRQSGRLYYWPRPGEDMPRVQAVAPVLAQLIRLEGKPEAGQFIEYISFRDLTFAHAEWFFPEGFHAGQGKVEIEPAPEAQVGGFAQAAIGVPGAVWGAGVRHCSFSQCRYVKLGAYALELGRGCQFNQISGCELADLGAGGIKLGETSIRSNANEQAHDNEVSDCRISDGGKIFPSAIGVWIGQSYNNRLVHTEICDFYYTGISIGWTWGYGPALATNNLVEWNHVHHIGKKSDGDGPILSDMGGIYTLGLHTGSVIRNNLWHDLNGLRYGGWGIYFDEGTTGILAENNLVYRTTHGGFHQHYGKNNLVRNNIFAYARDWEIQRSRQEPHLSFTFEHNLMLWKQGVPLGGNFDGTTTNFVMSSNLYWFAGQGEVKFAGKTFAQWQQAGHDTNSLFADPLFVDPQNGNFTLAPNSPAFKIGFKAFDLQAVGPRQHPKIQPSPGVTAAH